MMSSGFSFSSWLAEVSTQVPSIFSGQHYKFQTVDGTVSVRTEGALSHSGGACTRARCNETGMEFDLRRLRVSAKSGGLVTLQMLEALERESDLAANAGSHPHIVRCYASLVENIGVDHCRLLLRDPCCSNLSAHLQSHGGELHAGAVAEIGEQLSLGLRHLHSLDILCGSVTVLSVLLGCDGKWKLLGDLGAAAMLPIHVDEWQSQRNKVTAEVSQMPLPPEARPLAVGDDNNDRLVSLTLDIWILGALLAQVLQGVDSRCIGGTRAGKAVLAASQDILLCSFSSRLWMLLHWLLSTEPSHRPSSWRLVEIMHSLSDMSPHELLIEMPEYARFHCHSMATAAARSLAYASVASTGANRSCVAGLPLEVLRMSLVDTNAVDQLCENCALELGDLPTTEESAPEIPDLVPVLSVPPVDVEANDTITEKEEYSSSLLRVRTSSLDADESTDAGSVSGDESNPPSVASSSDVDAMKDIISSSHDPPSAILPRQRRPMGCTM